MPQSEWIILAVAAAVACAVLARLYFVLGRRTGHERPPGVPAPSSPDAAAPYQAPAPARIAAPAVPQPKGLMDIQLADRNFETAKFLEGARTAYGLIVTAFEKGDTAALRPLVSEEVFAAFKSAIAARDGASHTLVATREARITAAEIQDGAAEITVAFTATFQPPGEAVGAPHEVTDVWTFARALNAADPNWTLIATSGDVGPDA